MKTFLNKFLAISSLVLLVLAACKKEGDLVTATSGTAGTLSATTTTMVLTSSNASKTAVTFNTTAADYGYSSGATYTLQLDIKGDSFATPKEVTLDAGSLSKSYTTFDFNAMLLSMKLSTTLPSQVEVRIKSSLSAKAGIVYSNVVTLTVTPYLLSSYLWVPGDYQGWIPGSADSLASNTSNGAYEGYIYFPATSPSFLWKLTPARNWNASYGYVSASTMSLTAGGNLYVGGAGYYLIKANTNDLTWSALKTTWSAIGDATPGGWSSDTDLTYDPVSKSWSATMNLTAANIKFRANHDWGLNYGDDTPVDGLLTLNGANIPVSVAGKYLVTLKLNKRGAYTYTLVKQ